MKQGKAAGGRWGARELALCGLFAALTAVGAFIKITIPLPLYTMHFTMQWFFVLLAGYLLGARLACTSVCTYLVIGLVGIPVFAAGGGLAYLIRPTFGFLLGFAFAAYMIGKICEWIHSTSIKQFLVSGTVGLIVYYVVGAVYFYLVGNYVVGLDVGWKLVLLTYCLPTVFPDFLLCVLAAWVAVRMRKALAAINKI